jgi:hypothetical protein
MVLFYEILLLMMHCMFLDRASLVGLNDLLLLLLLLAVEVRNVSKRASAGAK